MVTVKTAVVSPAGTVTVGGTVAAALLLDSVTVYPPAAAGFVNPIIPTLFEPPVTTFGTIPRLDNVPGGGTGINVTLADFDAPPSDPVMVTGVFAATTELVAVIIPVCEPAGIVSVAGTLTTGLLLTRETTAPLACAPADKVMLTGKELPPTAWRPAVSAAITGGAGGGGPSRSAPVW